MIGKEKTTTEKNSAEKIKKWYQAELEKAQLESNARLESQLREREVQLRERQLKIEQDLLARRSSQIEQEEKRRLKIGLERLQAEYDTQSKKFEDKISSLIAKEKAQASARLNKKLTLERDRLKKILQDRRAQTIKDIEGLRKQNLEKEEIEIKQFRTSLMREHDIELVKFTNELKEKERKISEERILAAKTEEEKQFNERIKISLDTLKQESEIRMTDAIAKEDIESQLRIKKLIAKEKDIVEMARIESEQKLRDEVNNYRSELKMAAGLESQKRIDRELRSIETAYQINLKNKKQSLKDYQKNIDLASEVNLVPNSVLDSVDLSVKSEDPSLEKGLLEEIDISLEGSDSNLDKILID